MGTYLDLDLPVSFVATDDELLLSRTIVHEEQRGVCGSIGACFPGLFLKLSSKWWMHVLAANVSHIVGKEIKYRLACKYVYSTTW